MSEAVNASGTYAIQIGSNVVQKPRGWLSACTVDPPDCFTALVEKAYKHNTIGRKCDREAVRWLYAWCLNNLDPERTKYAIGLFKDLLANPSFLPFKGGVTVDFLRTNKVGFFMRVSATYPFEFIADCLWRSRDNFENLFVNSVRIPLVRSSTDSDGSLLFSTSYLRHRFKDKPLCKSIKEFEAVAQATVKDVTDLTERESRAAVYQDLPSTRRDGVKSLKCVSNDVSFLSSSSSQSSSPPPPPGVSYTQSLSQQMQSRAGENDIQTSTRSIHPSFNLNKDHHERYATSSSFASLPQHRSSHATGNHTEQRSREPLVQPSFNLSDNRPHTRYATPSSFSSLSPGGAHESRDTLSDDNSRVSLDLEQRRSQLQGPRCNLSGYPSLFRSSSSLAVMEHAKKSVLYHLRSSRDIAQGDIAAFVQNAIKVMQVLDDSMKYIQSRLVQIGEVCVYAVIIDALLSNISSAWDAIYKHLDSIVIQTNATRGDMNDALNRFVTAFNGTVRHFCIAVEPGGCIERCVGVFSRDLCKAEKLVNRISNLEDEPDLIHIQNSLELLVPGISTLRERVASLTQAIFSSFCAYDSDNFDTMQNTTKLCDLIVQCRSQHQTITTWSSDVTKVVKEGKRLMRKHRGFLKLGRRMWSRIKS